MEWPLAVLIVSLVVTSLGFLWGVIKVFKKPHEDENWKEPLDTFKENTREENRACQKDINNKISDINKKIIEHGNKIHDLEKDRDMLNKSLDELKGDVKQVSGKCDTILDKVIEYMSKD